MIPEGGTLCSLCSRLRRGVLYRVAGELGATKIALGHHRDDILATFFLNLFFGGKLKTMPPKLVSDDGRHVVIRPLAYVRERDLARYADLMRFPIIPCNLCGSQEHLQRKQVTAMLREWETQAPGPHRVDLQRARQGRRRRTSWTARSSISARCARPAGPSRTATSRSTSTASSSARSSGRRRRASRRRRCQASPSATDDPRRDPPRACASRMTESDDALERAGPWLFAAAVALGAWLRLDQFTAQVLIDDEWHAVHQLLKLTPSQMWLDFGHADYSIPLGLLYGLEARAFGLTETAMRWPMLVGGLATLVLFPLYVARRLGRATAAVFALLLAISPLLVIYSRMARPYAITLFLAWSAHAAFHRFDAAPRGRIAAGAAYAVAAAGRLASPDHRALRRRTVLLGGLRSPARVPRARAARASGGSSRSPSPPAHRWRRCSCRRSSRIPNRWR